MRARPRANPWLAFRAHHERLHAQILSAGLTPALPGRGFQGQGAEGQGPQMLLSPTGSLDTGASVPRPRTPEWEQSVANAWRSLPEKERPQWAVAAAASKTARTAQQASKLEAEVGQGSPAHGAHGSSSAPGSAGSANSATAVVGGGASRSSASDCAPEAVTLYSASRCRKRNCAALCGDGGSQFCTQQEIAATLSERAAPFAVLEREWSEINVPKAAPATVRCPPWYRTCAERGICHATSPFAQLVQWICQQVASLAAEQEP